MKSPILTIAKNVINLVYPLHCAACAKPLDPLNESGVCELCRMKIRPNPKPYIVSSFYDSAYSACLYEDALKELIHSFKYKRRIALTELFADILIKFINDTPGIVEEIDLVTFVPLHSARLKAREFNQSKLLAAKISDAFKIILADTLDKTKATRNQNELSREDRLVNLKGAFRMRRDADVAARSVLLIDDVMTTGATLDECARVLKDGGAGKVRCLTLARGI